MTVKGGIRGTATRNVKIVASGAAGAAPAIGSLIVGGSVERCVISTGDSLIPTANARIGSVTIGGDMIASSIVSAATNPFNVFGHPDDTWIATNDSAIGGVTVGGRIVGTPLLETFGIVARSIGTVTAGGVALGMPAVGTIIAVGPPSSNAYIHVLP
jgi:hypothetical protein